jgi:phosphoribosylaminoimidazole-succinocarboxamide synthase
VRDLPAALQPHADELRGRTMLCRRLDMVPVECVARATSPARASPTTARRAASSAAAAAGLEDGSRCRAAVHPATKAAVGDHDENVSYEAVEQAVGAELAAELRRLTLAVYGRGAALAAERGPAARRHQARARATTATAS